jgi:hypothetical protein
MFKFFGVSQIFPPKCIEEFSLGGRLAGSIKLSIHLGSFLLLFKREKEETQFLVLPPTAQPAISEPSSIKNHLVYILRLVAVCAVAPAFTYKPLNQIGFSFVIKEDLS